MVRNKLLHLHLQVPAGGAWALSLHDHRPGLSAKGGAGTLQRRPVHRSFHRCCRIAEAASLEGALFRFSGPSHIG